MKEKIVHQRIFPLWGYIFTLIFLSNGLQGKEIFLKKIEEIYLYGFSPLRGKAEYVEYSKCKDAYYLYFFYPRAVKSSNEYIYVLIGRESPVYIYDNNYNLLKFLAKRGIEEGKFLGPCLSISQSVKKDKIIITDYKGRVNVFDEKGDFLWSFLSPSFGETVYFAQIYNNYLVTATRTWDYINKKEKHSIKIYDFKRKKFLKEFFISSQSMLDSLKENKVECLFNIHFCITKNGHIICNYSTSPEVYEYDMKGNLIHKYDEVPFHYLYVKEEENKVCRKMGGLKDWIDVKFSLSGWPVLYGESMFVIMRGTKPPIYLDFYSLEERRYIGYCKIDKSLLFCDENYIYLCEDVKDTVMVIGKYKISMGKNEEKIYLIESSQNFLGRIKEKTSALGSFKKELSFSKFKIKTVEGKDENLGRYLSRNKNSIILFVKARECLFFPIYKQLREFWRLNKSSFDLFVIINHPVVNEAEFFPKEVEPGGKIIVNTSPERIKELGFNRLPFIIVVDKKGEIKYRFDPYKEKSMDALLESLYKIEKEMD